MESDVSDGQVLVKAMDDERLVSMSGGNFGEAVSSMATSRPSKRCRHFVGYLRGLPENAGIPDECAVCSIIMKCYVRTE